MFNLFSLWYKARKLKNWKTFHTTNTSHKPNRRDTTVYMDEEGRDKVEEDTGNKKNEK